MGISLLPMAIGIEANVNGGWTPYHYFSTASTNATNIKNAPGTIGYVTVVNTTATVYYFKLFDKASAPTLGTDTPVHSWPVPASTTGAGFSLPVPAGINFNSGISFAITANQADSDNTIAATGVTVNLGYL